MEYLFYYLIAGTILVFFTNLIVYILKKDTEFKEFPFVIIWFGFIMNLFSFTIKNTAIALGVLIVFPFLNMFVAYENLTKRKHILNDKFNNEIFSGYDLEISDNSLELIKKRLKELNISYKEKHLKNNIKVCFINALRKTTTNLISIEKAKNSQEDLKNRKELFTIYLDFDYIGFKYLLNKELECDISIDDILISLKKDLISYVKSKKENLDSFEYNIDDNENIYFNVYNVQKEKYERKTVVFETNF